MSATEDVESDDLVRLGRIAAITIRGRRSGQRRKIRVGFVEEEPGGSILIAAGPIARWPANLEMDPTCTVTIGDETFEATAELLEGAEHAMAVRELILRYGSPSENLGAGPAFRLRRIG